MLTGGIQFKPYLATAKGGFIMTAEIVAFEPKLCIDNRYRVTAVTAAGAEIELAVEGLMPEELTGTCEMLAHELFKAKTYHSDTWRK